MVAGLLVSWNHREAGFIEEKLILKDVWGFIGMLWSRESERKGKFPRPASGKLGKCVCRL